MIQGVLWAGEAPSATAERVLVADAPCSAPGCDRPAKGRHGRFCSDSCRARAWKARPRTQRQRILARLRQGPATGEELRRAGGGNRYGARILELRRAGHRIETDRTGKWAVYRLEAGKEEEECRSDASS